MEVPMPLFAVWSFASPWLLFWGTAAVLPVLIHLWSRRRYFETPWAATQFLLAAIRRHQRRLRIEHWLLLAIRALILVLLAIALAEPVVTGIPGISARMRQPPMHIILVIDTSYSMEHETAGTTCLAEARSQAAKLVEAAAPGDAFSLVRLADPPDVIIGEPSASHTAVLNEINRLKSTNRGANLEITLEHVQRLIHTSEARFDDQRIHIFSDLGKATWSDSLSQNGRTRLSTLTQTAGIQLHSVGKSGNSDNTAITRIVLPGGGVNVGEPVSAEVHVASFASHQQLRKRVELSVNGKRVGEHFVDLESGGLATAIFPLTFNVAGEHLLVASIGDDGLKLDNQRWLSVPVRDATRVICIQGRAHAGEYVALALQAGDEPGGSRVDVASEHAILERSLHEYDCIFLCNVARFTTDEAKRLLEYVEQGGGLVFVLGDLVRSDLYNQQFGPASATKLLPAALKEVVADGRHTFDPLEYRHPLTLPFRGHERAGLLTVPVWRYIRLDQVVDAASIALAFDSGDPAIIEAPVGQGRVLLMATAASPESMDRVTEPLTPWTALASWPSFPPLVHEIVRFAKSNRVAQRNVLVGDLLSSRLPSESSNSRATLSTPERQIAFRLDGTERVWTYGQTDQPGVYRFALEDEATPDMLFTVNLDVVDGDTSESDLKPVPIESLSSFLDTATEPAVETHSRSARDVPLFRLALGGVLGLLVVETFLASRFGRAPR